MTMAASTITPIAIAMPPSDMMLASRPCRYMTMKASRIETGIDRIATNAERKWKRKTTQTSATMIDSSISVWVSVVDRALDQRRAVVGDLDLDVLGQPPLAAPRASP